MTMVVVTTKKSQARPADQLASRPKAAPRLWMCTRAKNPLTTGRWLPRGRAWTTSHLLNWSRMTPARITAAPAVYLRDMGPAFQHVPAAAANLGVLLVFAHRGVSEPAAG